MRRSAEERGLRGSVDPDDWLVYADWLADHDRDAEAEKYRRMVEWHRKLLAAIIFQAEWNFGDA